MEAAKKNSTNYIVAGVILIAIAVGLFIFLDEDKESGCGVGSAGIAAIATGLNRGHSVEAIVASGAVGTACTQIVKSMSGDPEEPVDFTFESSLGDEEQTTTGFELTETAEEPVESSIDPDVVRAFDCFTSYREVEFLNRMCQEGRIDP